MVRSLLFNSNTFASLFWYFPRAVSTISEGDQKALSTQQHWDSRYAGGREDGLGEHEWFRSFKDLRPFLIKHLPSPAVRPRILHLGSGTSVSSVHLVLCCRFRRASRAWWHYPLPFSVLQIDICTYSRSGNPTRTLWHGLCFTSQRRLLSGSN